MLNSSQQRAVQVVGHCLITAPPGSGKTTVLKERAAHLLRTDRGGGRLIGVTFTADAAAELEDRIRRECPDAGDRVLCGTFHSLCKRQLEEAELSVRLISDVQQQDLVWRSYKECVSKNERSTHPFENAIKYIDTRKGAVIAYNPKPSELVYHEIYETYCRLLKELGVMDFSDLLGYAVRGMRTPGSGVLPLACKHMLVDEFQDTDPIQYTWVDAHRRAGAQITVVGDDDQSIYGWRAAGGYPVLMQFKDESKATSITLDTTYRCARSIIESASTLIKLNQSRVDKTITTANRSRGQVWVKPSNDRDDEIFHLCSQIAMSGTPGEWGVLARNNRILTLAEAALKAQHFEVKRRGGTPFWETKIASTYVGLCRSIVQGDMLGVDSALRRCGVGMDVMNRLHTQLGPIRRGALHRFLASTPYRGIVGELQSSLIGWRRNLASREDDLVIHGVAQFLQKHASFTESNSAKDRELSRKILTLCAKLLAARRGSLAVRLVSISRDSKVDGEPSEAVSLMTLHAAKGLEFRYVWILGADQGVIPSDKSNDREEERRLFYVGMTRAIEGLWISYDRMHAGPSQFIAEANLV